ncbi:MAG: dihydrofolate reductase, partial [Saprospiraceae bacterium]|nr:dihydrofolate reductase [Saprospiraceae bacterium]
MRLISWLFISLLFVLCTDPQTDTASISQDTLDEFQWEIDRFADTKILRYQVPDFDRLSLDQKKLVYFLTEAG